MKQRVTTAQDIASLGSILSIWAHPDDETFSCAGIMAIAVANGQNVACITATKGEAGVQDESRWPAAELASIRANELADALAIVGVHHHHWLGYHDGRCQDVDDQQAAGQLAEYINLYQPDTILTFGPEGMTGHPDHKSISRWVSAAVRLSSTKPEIYHSVQLEETYEKYLKSADKQFDIFFNIDKPPLVTADVCDICVNLPKDACDKKCRALAAMPSQTEGMLHHFGDKRTKVFGQETFVRAK